MSLLWVKLHTSLLDNSTFRRFSPEARLTFLTALMIAGKQDLGGRLEVPPYGAMTVGEIAETTGLAVDVQRGALDQLEHATFLTKSSSGIYAVNRWAEKTSTSTERMRRLRERQVHRSSTDGGNKRTRTPSATASQRDAKCDAPSDAISDVPSDERCDTGRDTQRDRRVAKSRDVQSKEEEKDKERELLFASLRSAAVAYGSWPDDPEAFRALARIFLERFANCKSAPAQRRHLSTYTAALATYRARNASIAQAWTAVESAWELGGREPLHGDKIKYGLSHLERSARAQRVSNIVAADDYFRRNGITEA